MLLQATEIVFTSFTETIVVAFDVTIITHLFDITEFVCCWKITYKHSSTANVFGWFQL